MTHTFPSVFPSSKRSSSRDPSFLKVLFLGDNVMCLEIFGNKESFVGIHFSTPNVVLLVLSCYSNLFIIAIDGKRVRNDILQPITLDIHLLTYSLKNISYAGFVGKSSLNGLLFFILSSTYTQTFRHIRLPTKAWDCCRFEARLFLSSGYSVDWVQIFSFSIKYEMFENYDLCMAEKLGRKREKFFPMKKEKDKFEGCLRTFFSLWFFAVTVSLAPAFSFLWL